jgi:hypothetical protein
MDVFIANNLPFEEVGFKEKWVTLNIGGVKILSMFF